MIEKLACLDRCRFRTRIIFGNKSLEFFQEINFLRSVHRLRSEEFVSKSISTNEIGVSHHLETNMKERVE